MTNSQFDAWASRHFRSTLACAKALGLDRETVTALRAGRTRKGSPCPVPAHIAMACAGWTIGAHDYDGGRVAIG